MQIKFVKTRYVYDSYSDMISLIELSGFSTCYVDEIDIEQPICYITFCINGEYRPHLDNWLSKKPKNCILIIWLLERPCSTDKTNKLDEFVEGNIKLLNNKYADYIFISDKALANEHKDPRVQFLILGSHKNLNPGLKWHDCQNKKWDFIHLSYITHRRSLIYDRLIENKLKDRKNCWRPERDDAIRFSKIFINIHQDFDPYCEPLRIALAASYAIPYVSEHVIDNYPLINNMHYIDVEYSQAKQKFIDIIKDYIKYEQIGKNLYNLLCEQHTFENSVIKKCKEFNPDIGK